MRIITKSTKSSSNIQNVPFNKKSLIVQHNDLINARYRLSLAEKRVVLWLIGKIKQQDEDFKKYRLKISEFAEMVGITGENQYARLKEITENLIKRVMNIHKPDGGLLQVAWLSAADYEKNKGSVLLEFSPSLKPFLLHLQGHFTCIQLEDLFELKSIYAVRIFELLKQYESIGKREVNLVDLRECLGMPQEQYANYKDFRKRVVEPSKAEINLKTPLLVDYTEKKEGRKVATILFTIKKKPTEFEQHQQEKAMIIEKELRSETAIVEALIEYGFARRTSLNMIKNNEESVIQNAIKAVNLQKSRGRVNNPKGMLRVAIKEKWHPEKYVDRKAMA